MNHRKERKKIVKTFVSDYDTYEMDIEAAGLATIKDTTLVMDGELFEIDHNLAGKIFEISPSTFRKRLSRARKNLYDWMNNRCGLVNQDNPCRCSKKQKGL